jgi:hypothetical protein
MVEMTYESNSRQSPVNSVSCYSPQLTVQGGMHLKFDAWTRNDLMKLTKRCDS